VKAASETIDARIRSFVQAGEMSQAATEVLRAYGGEIFGFLMALHKSESDASDVYSIFSERLWKAMSGFEFRSAVRTWAYVLARNASSRYQRDRGRRERREVHPSTDALFSGVALEVRSETLRYLRTETKNEVRALRESLPVDDQTLLILRVDRELEWLDIARVFLESKEGKGESDDALKKEAARLRKRFQLVKDRLTKMGKDRGLI
jgi:RNA polymerase sigma-70 factor (ECF subfamily)